LGWSLLRVRVRFLCMNTAKQPTRRSTLAYHLLACAPVFSIFFLIPLELYYTAQPYWNFDRGIPLDFVMVGLGVLVAVQLLQFVAFRIHRTVGAGVALSLFGLGLYILFADLFAPLQSSFLDGTELTSSEPLRLTLLELFFLVAVTAWIVIGKSKRVLPAATWLTGGLVAVCAGYLAVVALTPRPTMSVSAGSKPPASITGNVYHIVLDEMQTDAALLMLEEPERRARFDGFTLFENTMSTYIFTRASLPNYLSSRTYEPGTDLRDWELSFKGESVFDAAHQSGYQVVMFSPRPLWAYDAISKFKSLQQVYQEVTSNRAALYNDFARIWLARLCPNLLTNEALEQGKRLGQWVAARRTDASQNRLGALTERFGYVPQTIAEGLEPFASVLMLEELTKSEKDRPAAGIYVYAHGLLPHGPYVMNADLKVNLHLRGRPTLGYVSHVQGAFVLLENFIAELKRLDRYESSTIVIHADTGHGHRGFVSRTAEGKVVSSERTRAAREGGVFEQNSLKWNRHQLFSRTRPLLMIKPARAAGPMQVSEVLAQLVDLYPTMKSILNLKGPPPPNGVALFSEAPPPDREAAFYVFDHEDHLPDRVLRVVLEDQADPVNSKWSVETISFDGS
jgi:hypothetical protein